MSAIKQLVNRDQFGHWLNNHARKTLGVEVGTYTGEYAALLAGQWEAGMLHTIDPYDWPVDPTYVDGCRKDWTNGGELDPENVRHTAAKLLTPIPGVSMIRRRSLEASFGYGLESLAFVYLDGNHAREAVAADIDAWWPRVAAGGVLCGHDFYDRDDDAQKCGVATAVWNFSEHIGVRPHITPCTSWWIIKA